MTASRKKGVKNICQMNIDVLKPNAVMNTVMPSFFPNNSRPSCDVINDVITRQVLILTTRIRDTQ